MMCYKIIEEYYGKLYILSELNKGMIVDIELLFFLFYFVI